MAPLSNLAPTGYGMSLPGPAHEFLDESGRYAEEFFTLAEGDYLGAVFAGDKAKELAGSIQQIAHGLCSADTTIHQNALATRTTSLSRSQDRHRN
jgi:hypothetical protein